MLMCRCKFVYYLKSAALAADSMIDTTLCAHLPPITALSWGSERAGHAPLASPELCTPNSPSWAEWLGQRWVLDSESGPHGLARHARHANLQGWHKSSAQEGMWMVTADQSNQHLTLGVHKCAPLRDEGGKGWRLTEETVGRPQAGPEGKLGTSWPEAAGAGETKWDTGARAWVTLWELVTWGHPGPFSWRAWLRG